MNPSSDDQQIRELIRRVRRADQSHTPAFDDVLSRPRPEPKHRLTPALRAAVVCGAVAALLAVFFFLRSTHNDPPTGAGRSITQEVAPTPPVASQPNERVVDIDFDHLHEVVDEYFGADDSIIHAEVPPWPTRTQSLLALNLHVSLVKE